MSAQLLALRISFHMFQECYPNDIVEKYSINVSLYVFKVKVFIVEDLIVLVLIVKVIVIEFFMVQDI